MNNSELILLLSDVASMLPVAARLHPDDLQKLQTRVLQALTAPAALVESAKSFPISRNDAKILLDAQDQISDIITKLYVDTGLLVEEVQLIGSPRPQAWLKVKKL